MSRFYYTGLSLIELMISLTISSVILLACDHLLLHSIRTYHQQQQYIASVEKIRYLEFIFTQAVHLAGFLGCHTIQQAHIYSSLKNWYLANPYIQNSNHAPPAIIAYHIGNGTLLPTFLDQHAKQNSDILIINNLSPKTAVLQQTMQNRNSPLVINNKLNFKKNNIAVINDCHHTDFFAISSINNHNPIIIRHNISIEVTH